MEKIKALTKSKEELERDYGVISSSGFFHPNGNETPKFYLNLPDKMMKEIMGKVVELEFHSNLYHYHDDRGLTKWKLYPEWISYVIKDFDDINDEFDKLLEGI